jgi:hypothetical protein
MTSSNPEASVANRVFVLHHSYEADGCDETKLIGIYSSKTKAEDAIKRLADQPGFREHPADFSIDPYRLDVDHWAEGFSRS